MAELIQFTPLITNHGADDDNILRWIIRVDDHIDKESVDIMKLGMRGELTQRERDAAPKPSDLYHALAKHYEEPVALARFIYALEKLGHRRHGHRAVRQLSEFSISKQEKFTPDMSIRREKLKLFLLHQCLVEVLVHLEEEHHPVLIFHFTTTYLHGANPNTINSPCTLFTQLLDKGVIGKDNIDVLAEGLRKIGDHRNADRVVKYLHSFSHDRIDLHTYAEASRSDTSSVTEAEPIPNKKEFRRYTVLLIFIIIFVACGLISLAIMVCEVAVPSVTKNHTALLSLRSNSTVILFDRWPSIDFQSLTIAEDTSYPGDFDHEILIYEADSDCSGIQAQEEVQELSETNFSPINGTTSYMLAGSSMTYNICGSTNSSYQSERLELALLYGLEALRSPSRDYDKFYFFPYGTDGNWMCKQVTYNMEKNGYYTPVFLTVPQEATYVYSVTYQRRFLNVSSFSSSLFYKLNNDKDSFTFDSQHCFVGKILENPTDTSPYAHIYLVHTYIKNDTTLIWIGFGLFNFTIIMIIVLILIMIYC